MGAIILFPFWRRTQKLVVSPSHIPSKAQDLDAGLANGCSLNVSLTRKMWKAWGGGWWGFLDPRRVSVEELKWRCSKRFLSCTWPGKGWRVFFFSPHLKSGERSFRQSSRRAWDAASAVWGTPWAGVCLMHEKSKGPELAKVAWTWDRDHDRGSHLLPQKKSLKRVRQTVWAWLWSYPGGLPGKAETSAERSQRFASRWPGPRRRIWGNQSEAKWTCPCQGNGWWEIPQQDGSGESGFGKPIKLPMRESVTWKHLPWPEKLCQLESQGLSFSLLGPPSLSPFPTSTLENWAASWVRRREEAPGLEKHRRGLLLLPFATKVWSFFLYYDPLITDVGLYFWLKATRGPFCYLRVTSKVIRPTL